MKAHIIVGKKQIIIAALVLLLGAAVYLNWQMTEIPAVPDAAVDAELSGLLAETQETAGEAQNQPQENETETKVLGEAAFVNAEMLSSDAYFASARLARSKARDEAIETISAVLNDDALSEADKQAASSKAVSLTDVIEAESRIENLIKAKGFADCMVYITDGGASVVVKSDGLTQDQATQIKNIVVSEGDIRGENISITEIK